MVDKNGPDAYWNYIQQDGPHHPDDGDVGLVELTEDGEEKPVNDKSITWLSPVWIKCDIDGKGVKWRLAIFDDNEEIFFPVEQFDDSAEAYKSDPQVKIPSAEKLIAQTAALRRLIAATDNVDTMRKIPEQVRASDQLREAANMAREVLGEKA